MNYPISDDLPLSPVQCLGARAMLGMSRADLAAMAKVAVSTLADFEVGKRTQHTRTVEALRVALEAAGAVFMATGEQVDGGPGVRVRGEK